MQDPLKANIFHPNCFLHVLPKKPRNKLLLGTHADYFIFNNIIIYNDADEHSNTSSLYILMQVLERSISVLINLNKMMHVLLRSISVLINATMHW